MSRLSGPRSSAKSRRKLGGEKSVTSFSCHGDLMPNNAAQQICKEKCSSCPFGKCASLTHYIMKYVLLKWQAYATQASLGPLLQNHLWTWDDEAISAAALSSGPQISSLRALCISWFRNNPRDHLVPIVTVWCVCVCACLCVCVCVLHVCVYFYDI